MCKRILPLTEDFFGRVSDPKRAFGFRYDCRDCHRAASKEDHIKKGPEYAREKSAKYRSTLKGKSITRIIAHRTYDRKHGFINTIGISFYLTNIVNRPCAYCGETENIGCDRIDNNLGHTEQNVIPCCGMCNVIRSNFFSYNEMILVGKFIRSEVLSKRKEKIKFWVYDKKKKETK